MQLRIQAGRLAGQVVDLASGETLLGSAGKCQLQLRDKGVSYRHAALRLEDGALTVEDLGSRGGTFVNGEQLASGELRRIGGGDVLLLGSVASLVVEGAPVAAPAPAPTPAPTPAPEPELAPAHEPEPRADSSGSEAGGEGGMRLRFRGGKREDETLALLPGVTRLGTGSRNDVQVREEGISFRHAEVQVDEGGQGWVVDLGSRAGTFVNEDRVPQAQPRPFGPGDVLRLGPVVALVLELMAPDEPLELGPALFPPEALEHLDPMLRELIDTASESEPLANSLDGDQVTDPARDEAARDLVSAALGVFAPGLLRLPVRRWLHYHAGDDEPRIVYSGSRGRAVFRRWELVARLTRPVPGGDVRRIANALGALLANVRQLPSAAAERVDGFWYRCTFSAGGAPIMGRFERVEVVTDGQVLAAALIPLLGVVAEGPGKAEDPIGILSEQQAERRLYRPPNENLGPGAPVLPPGGRYGRHRHLPSRSRS
jgi:pSer/pThr/pTyr-binding forkhead associated (FHA) protein